VLALRQLASHSALLRRRIVRRTVEQAEFPSGTEKYLNESLSLGLLQRTGIPVVEHRLCRTAEETKAAFAELGGPVAIKGCSGELPHKTEFGLVRLNVSDPVQAVFLFGRMKRAIQDLHKRFDGVLVARMAKARRELALGAHADPQFGPVVMIGDGGLDLEALNDVQWLLPPFDEDEVVERMKQLRAAPLLEGGRGRGPLDAYAFAKIAVRLGDAMLGWGKEVASVDVNPIAVFEAGEGRGRRSDRARLIIDR
jgi:succinyl-CoA synthetase beta subunit